MVTWNEEAVTRPLPGGEEQKLAWSALKRVKILTTDTGPLTTDFYFVLEGGDGKSLVVPQEEAGALLERLQRLPGFDNEAFILATASSENAEFLCWEQEDGRRQTADGS
jgi:hypothetical protein